MSPDVYEILAIAVLLAGAVPIVLGIGYFVFGYFSSVKQERSRASDRHITHPQLGPMTGREGLWEGASTFAGGTITLVVAGSDEGPDTKLADTLQGVLGRIEEYQSRAIERVIEDELRAPLRPADSPPIVAADFKLQSIDCLWEDKPSRFALEFSLDGDPDGVWRVEFENGRAVSVGRDD